MEPIYVGTASELYKDNLPELTIEELLALAEEQEEKDNVDSEGDDRE